MLHHRLRAAAGVETSAITEVRGLDPTYNTDLEYSNNDRTANDPASGWDIARGAAGSEHGSGKWYHEATIDRIGSSIAIGITSGEETTLPGLSSSFSGVGYLSSGRVYNQGSYTTHATYGVGDVISFAVDFDDGIVDIYKNNSLVTSEAIPTGVVHFVAPSMLNAQVTVGFVSTDLVYTPPPGYNPVGDLS